MYTLRLALALLLALTASALPFNTTTTTSTSTLPTLPTLDTRTPEHHHKHRNTFKLHVHNNCPFPKDFALYKITSDFQMKQKSKPVTIPSGDSHTIRAPFKATGMRLSGHAEWGAEGQWQPQALFEFGYSTYGGQHGTAYDLSVMEGSDGDIGVGAYPKNDACEAKTCFPWDCEPSQGWTSPGQTDLGSPADTVCYQGKTDFKVVFCP